MNEWFKKLKKQTTESLYDDNGLFLGYSVNTEKFGELVWKEAYQQGYDKGMSDCMDGQGGV